MHSLLSRRCKSSTVDTASRSNAITISPVRKPATRAGHRPVEYRPGCLTIRPAGAHAALAVQSTGEYTMKKNLACAVAMLAVALSLAGCGQMTPAQGWTALIDGTNC